MRKIILIVVGIVLLVLTIFAAVRIANPTKEGDPTPKRVAQNVYVEEVENSHIPIVISATGNVIAKERLELYAEVQGLFRSSSHDFKIGQRYQKGQTLISIDASEYRASVQATKSRLYNLIASVMPDLRLDYPKAYPVWQQYLQSFQIPNTTPPLPEFSTEQEKYFITGRNIQTTYFDLKNMEERLVKYNIRAPFSGIVTEALVTKGTLIRSGQKLGEFINTHVYEMEVSVPGNVANLLKIGENVVLNSIDNSGTYSGTITRINASVNPTTQTVTIFLEINDANVKEGMFLQANINGKDQENAYKVPRRLLVNETQLFIVRDSVLDLLDVKPVFYSAEDVVITGIPNGTKIISRTLPGAYAGQIVRVLENDSDINTTKPTNTISEN